MMRVELSIEYLKESLVHDSPERYHSIGDEYALDSAACVQKNENPHEVDM